MRLNAGTVSAPASRVIRLTQPLTLTGITAVTVNRAITGTPTAVVDRDANLLRTVGVSVTDYQMRLESFGGVPSSVAWSSGNPAVATVDAEGYVTHVANGSATITATAAGQSTSLTLTLSSTSGATVDELASYVSGSLAANATAAVDSRIAGKSPAAALPIFTTQNHSDGVYVRNTSCWAADLDLTCISPWNSVGGNLRAGTLISPRHVLFAAHYPAVAGMSIRFVSADNTVTTRTVSAVLTHPSYVPYFPDIQIGVLNSDVPAGIGFSRVLPATWADKLPAIVSERPIPTLCLDQEEKALVTDWFAATVLDRALFIAPYTINYQNRLAFYEDKVGGDSGNPAFLIVNNQLVLVTVWTNGGAGRGTFTTPQIAAINTMMATLGGGYQLTEVDLAGFPTYP